MIRFRVYGIPGPQGSKSYKGHRKGKPVLVESSKKVKPWRDAVKAAAQAAMIGQDKLTGPVSLVVTFYLPAPQRIPKDRKAWPTTLPDLDKLLRSTNDALTDAGLWSDDAQVCQIEAMKIYGINPKLIGASIEAEEM